MTNDPLRRRPRLGEIARGDVVALKDDWANTQAAASDPLPPGAYKCLATEGRLFNSRTNGTPGFKMVLQVLEGPYAGRRLWHDLWLTPDALPRTKYELGELGITDLDQLEEPLPVGRIVEVVVTRRVGDDGLPFNKVRCLKAILPARFGGTRLALVNQTSLSATKQPAPSQVSQSSLPQAHHRGLEAIQPGIFTGSSV